MGDLLKSKERTAVKDHICNYCGGIIHSGETYNWAKLSHERKIYEWKAHLKCDYIANCLWEYIDPVDGMTSEDFTEGLKAFCEEFTFPECTEAEGARDRQFYIDKAYDLLCTHKVVFDRENYRFTLEERVESNKAEEE